MFEILFSPFFSNSARFIFFNHNYSSQNMEELRLALFFTDVDMSRVDSLLIALNAESVDPAEFVFFKCISECKLKRFASCKGLIEQLKRLIVSPLILLFLNGFILNEKGDKKKTIGILRQLVIEVRNATEMAVLENIASEEGLLILGRIFLEKKLFDEGLAVSELLCLTSSRFSRGWELYGDFLLKRNNRKEAISCYERCMTFSSFKKLADSYYSEGMYIKCLNLYLCHEELSRDDISYKDSKLNMLTDIYGM